MFSLRDFLHLPELDGWVEQLAGSPGLAVVAGLDIRASFLENEPTAARLLPSGRSAILSILIDYFLTRNPQGRCQVIAEDPHSWRVPRPFHSRMQVLPVDPPYTYSGRTASAVAEHVGLLVLDRLDRRTLPIALEAAAAGLSVLAPLDTVFHGPEVVRHLLALGVSAEKLAALRWVISVQRLSTLCAKCKQPVHPDKEQLARLRTHPLLQSGRPGLDDLGAVFAGLPQFYQPGSCADCRQTGRHGEITVFDVYHNPPPAPGESQRLPDSSVLPLEAYIARLALRGYLSLDDFLDFEAEQFRRFGHTLLARDAALAQIVSEQERKQAELEAANLVLLQRTRTLVSLQEIGQALITSTNLKDLAGRVCRFAQDLCGADRVIVYYQHSEREAEALAAGGWDPQRVPPRCDPSPMFTQIGPRAADDAEPAVYNHWPPGIPPRHPDVEGAELRGGLYAPLIAQGKRLGFIVCHTTRRPRFAPKEVSLLKTLAQQVALGIQRARLVNDLRNKIIELEDAQVELAKKERLESELELARQVQQSMLPRNFPAIPGFQIAARNEPARQVGGDLYDVILLDEDHFGVAIADVSDKGMPAALYMALTRSLLRSEAPRAGSPQAMLERINRLLLELGDGKSFVTLFYGVVDRRTGQMTYCRAGHERPLLLHAGGAQFLQGDGTPLGILTDGFRLSEEEITLVPGDRLVLYTDGLCDVTATDGALFGLERLSALLESLVDQPLSQMCEGIFDHLLAYQGDAEQYDDMTLLVMEAGKPARR